MQKFDGIVFGKFGLPKSSAMQENAHKLIEYRTAGEIAIATVLGRQKRGFAEISIVSAGELFAGAVALLISWVIARNDRPAATTIWRLKTISKQAIAKHQKSTTMTPKCSPHTPPTHHAPQFCVPSPNRINTHAQSQCIRFV